jgi:DNA-binding GntR family transcriptional regulator
LIKKTQCIYEYLLSYARKLHAIYVDAPPLAAYYRCMDDHQVKDKGRIPAKKQLLAEKVYQGLRRMLADYRWKPGVRVNVMKMARELGVSRTPVWEAVRRLEQEGILQSIPNRGVFMAEASLERSMEVIQARGALDLLAVSLAASRITKKTLDLMNRSLSEQLQAIESADTVRYSSADFQFHRHIYTASGNGYILELFESTSLQMRPTRLNVLPALPSLYLWHQEILQGLADGDSGRAEKAMIRHTEIIFNLTQESMRLSLERKELVQRAKEHLFSQ